MDKIKKGLWLLMLLFTFYSKGQTITGTIVDEHNETIPFSTISLFDSRNKVIVNIEKTERDGSFKLEVPEKGNYSIKVVHARYSDTIFSNLYILRDTNLKLILNDAHEICEYDKSKHDKTCPVCQKSDQAIPISYGLLAVSKDEVEEFMKKVDVEFHLGGCMISGCDPNWYCKRDKTQF